VNRLVFVCLGLGGCLYLDPINQRPSLEIVNTSSEVIGRGQEDVTLEAVADDPDGHVVDVSWRIFVCDDAARVETCDPDPALESGNRVFVFDAPVRRANDTPAQSLLVELEGQDNLGAIARPSQQLIVPLGNGKPTLDVSHRSSYGSTLDTPIEVFAVYGDPDDSPDAVVVSFELLSPGITSAVPVNLCPPAEPECLDPMQLGKRERGIRFTPDLVGEWQVRVIATDPLGLLEGSTEVIETVVVVADQLPCLGVVSPQPPASSNLLPITDPTLFQVHQVLDAIDPFPTNLGDSILGQSSFHWSLEINGGARAVLATETGNSVALDPASFTPGDVVELRVEIADRNSPFPLTCDPAEPTCLLDPTQVTCLQRQTWKVEVR
jgi:hypothetical protein